MEDDASYTLLRDTKKNNRTKRDSDDELEENENKNTGNELTTNKINKKNRRPKRIRRVLKQLKIMYSNVRGIKSKINSLAGNIDEVNPSILCLVETHLDKKENLEISGYTPYRLDGTSNSAGILIAVVDTIKAIVVEIEEFTDIGYIKWILINNGKVAIRLGVVYAPQENVTSAQDLKKLYENIQYHAIIAQDERQLLIVLGDFNCKVGEFIKGNTNTVTKGGRLLLKMLRKNNLQLLNSSDNTKGVWTRVEKKNGVVKKSVLDYMVMNEKSYNLTQQMLIDEDKMIPIYTLNNKVKTYSDHNTMICKMSIINDIVQDKQKTVMTKRSYEEYTNAIQEQELSKSLQKDQTVQENYDKWSSEVEKIIKRVQRKKKTTNKRKDERHLVKMIKCIKRELKKEHNGKNGTYLKKRISIIKDHLVALKARIRGERLKKRIQMIKQKDRLGLWQVKRQISKKHQSQKQIKTTEGQILSKPDDIINEYKKHYTNLLMPKQAMNAQEREAETRVEQQFKNVYTKAVEIGPVKDIEESEVKEAVKRMKLHKAGDRQGWKAEWLKKGGDEMIKSLTFLFNQMERELEIPKQWKDIKITSIQKSNNGSTLNETQRGLFITNIVSKAYEKVKKMNNEIHFNKISPMQMAGRKHRSTMDNLIIVSGIIADNKAKNIPTYLFFGDAEKCFDKLWLKDSILEIVKLGVPENDAIMLYLMNAEANIVVNTPIGYTQEIIAKEIVRQGTIFGPVFCCASTAQINEIGEKVVEKCGNTDVGILVFMDDINTTTSQVNNIKNTIKNCRLMEIEKKYTFGMKKTKYMVIDEKELKENIDTKLEKGIVQRISEYKYVGLYINEKGDLKLHKQKMEERAMNSYKELIAMGCVKEVGGEFLRIRLILFVKCWMPAVTHGLHAWSLLTDKDIMDVEQLQGRYLKKICEVPVSTPSAGLYMELGIWPATEWIQYLSAMLYHELMKGDDNRVSSKIVKEQSKKDMKCSLPQRVKSIMKYVNYDMEDIHNLKKSTWKRMVKRAMKEKIDARLKESMLNKTKSRFAIKENFGEAMDYIKIHTGNNAIDILKVRLNMTETKSNFKSKYTDLCCPKCKIENDTTEHVVQCFTDVKVNEISNPNSSEWIKIINGFRKYKDYKEAESSIIRSNARTG